MDDTTSHFIYEEINFRERKYPVFASIAVLTIPVLLLWMGVIVTADAKIPIMLVEKSTTHWR